MTGRRRATAGPAASADGESLSVAQRAALERMAAGDTAKGAAAAAGVSRQAVHKWLSGDAAFRAAYNAWQAEAVETTRARLLALADAAVTTVAGALAKGDARTALTILQRQGLLTPPKPGPTDPALVAHQARQGRARVNDAMMAADEVLPPELFAADAVSEMWADDPALGDPNAADLARLDGAPLAPAAGPRRLPGPMP